MLLSSEVGRDSAANCLNLVESRSGLDEKHTSERTRGITAKDGVVIGLP